MDTLEAHVQAHNALLQDAYLALHFAIIAHSHDNHMAAMNAFWIAIENYFESIGKFSLFTCKKGCSHCCFDNPHGVSGMELIRIIPLLDTEQKEKIQKQAQEYKAIKKTQENPQIFWKSLCQPCPLLKNNQCSIYQQRPLACRSFFSLSSPQWCHPGHKKYQSNPQIDCDSLHSRLVECANKYGLPGSTDLLTGLASLLEEK